MRVLVALAAASALVAGSAVPATAAPARIAAAPGIVLLSATGSGCRPATTVAALSADRTAITILYSDYLVASAGSIRPTSRNCRLNLKITAAPGYAPTITSVDYRGFASVAAGSVVRMTATYGFHGEKHLTSSGLRLTGPFDDTWSARDAAGSGLLSANCTGSRVLDLDTTLTLTSSRAGAADDFATMDSTDLVAPSTFRLTWKKCP